MFVLRNKRFVPPSTKYRDPPQIKLKAPTPRPVKLKIQSLPMKYNYPTRQKAEIPTRPSQNQSQQEEYRKAPVIKAQTPSVSDKNRTTQQMQTSRQRNDYRKPPDIKSPTGTGEYKKAPQVNAQSPPRQEYSQITRRRSIPENFIKMNLSKKLTNAVQKLVPKAASKITKPQRQLIGVQNTTPTKQRSNSAPHMNSKVSLQTGKCLRSSSQNDTKTSVQTGTKCLKAKMRAKSASQPSREGHSRSKTSSNPVKRLNSSYNRSTALIAPMVTIKPFSRMESEVQTEANRLKPILMTRHLSVPDQYLKSSPWMVAEPPQQPVKCFTPFSRMDSRPPPPRITLLREARVNSNINSHRNRSLNEPENMYENQVSIGQNYSMHSNSFHQGHAFQNSNPMNRSMSYQQNSSFQQSNSKDRLRRSNTHNANYDSGGPAYDVPRYDADYQYNYPSPNRQGADENEVSVDSYEFGSQRGGSQRNSRSRISSQSESVHSGRSAQSSVRTQNIQQSSQVTAAEAGLTCNCEDANRNTITTYSTSMEDEGALTCNCELGKQQQNIIYEHAEKSLSSNEVDNQNYTSSVSNSYDSYATHMVAENKTVRSEAMLSNGHIGHDFSMMESGPELTSTPEPAEAIVEEERINEDGTTSIIRRTVTAKTSQICFENETPKIEVHISPATIISPDLSPTGQKFTSQKTHHSSHHSSTSVKTTSFKTGDQRQHQDTSSIKSGTSSYKNDSASLARSSMKSTDTIQSQKRDSDSIARLSMRSTDTMDTVHSQRSQKSQKSQKSRMSESISSQRTCNGMDSVNGHGENMGMIQVEYSRSIDGDEGQVSFSDNIETNFETMSANEIDYGGEIQDSSSFGYEYNQDMQTQRDYNVQLDGRSQMYNVQQGASIDYTRDMQQGAKAEAKVIATTEAIVTVSKDSNERRHMSGGEVVVDMGKMKTMEKNVKVTEKLQITQLFSLLQSGDKVLISNACGYIMHLVYNDDDAKRKIREVDLIPILVGLLDHDDEDVLRNAAGALKNLSYGQFMDDNKMAIFKCGGVAACYRLLHKLVWIEVREHVTGILYNISTVKEIKYEILKETLEVVSVLVVIPLSGWEKESSIMGKKPGVITWTALLRNSTGVLRNVSSAGKEARMKIRAIEGLLDALVWILRAGIADQNKSEINNKVIENIMCTLRNVSYKIDLEIDRDVYLDAIKQSTKGVVDTASQNNDNPDDGYTEGEDVGFDGKRKFGCMGMKKKPLMKRINNLKGRFSLRNNKEQPPPEEWKYLIPVQEDNPVALGVELLWQPDLVTLYVHIITNSTNPVTLEAAAGAIHNLCGSKWNWAGLHRIHIRLQKGIPPMHDLLTVDQEYVVRAVAYALRNMSIDATNKWSIGKFAYKTLLQVLPPPNATEKDTEPCGYTICTILSVLQVLVYKNYTNSKYVKDGGGIPKLIALTREGPRGPNDNSNLRLYSRRVVIEANRVLLYMWDFKECRDVIQQKHWSHSSAVELEKSYVAETEKINDYDYGDTYAHMKCVQDPAVYGRDLRRFIDIEETRDGTVLINRDNRRDNNNGYTTDDIEMAAFDDGMGEETTLLDGRRKKKGNNLVDSAV